MPTLPTIVERSAQPYVAIRALVTMEEIGPTGERLLPEVFGWLAKRGITPAGAPFFKYNVIDMARQLEIEFGVPVSKPISGDDRVVAGTLPPGRYGTMTHRGHYDELYGVNAALIDWAKERGIVWDMKETAAGDAFGCRLEIYETDPEEEPDPANWETVVAIRLADDIGKADAGRPSV